MKIAVVGAGYWGKKHIHDYIENGIKPLVCDLDENNLRYCKEHYGVKTIRDHKRVATDNSIVGVSICTPNPTHYTLCKEFLLAGKHVLLEKPMTLNSREAEELVKLARERGLVLNVGHVFRFNNALMRLKEMLNKGELGEIYIAKLTWTNLEPIFKDRDVLFDLAPHPFDIVHYIFEKYPTEISCVGGSYRRPGGEEAAFVNCRIDGTIVNLEISWITPKKVRTLTLVCSKKTAFVDCLSQEVRIYDNAEESARDLDIKPSDPLREELKHFLECIENRRLYSIADGMVGMEVIKMIETARKSLEEKRTIEFIE